LGFLPLNQPPPLPALGYLQHWQERKGKQDEQLDRIGRNVDLLGEIANTMGEALDR
jgi:hypothetical protein